MKKIAIAIGLALQVMGAAHASSLGETKTTAGGVLTVIDTCEVQLKINTPAAEVLLSEVHNDMVFAEASAESKCPGRIWIRPDGEQDDWGRGVMTGSTGAQATYVALPKEGNSELLATDDGKHVVATPAIGQGGATVAELALADFWKGLPKVADRYEYKIAAGFLVE